MAGQAARAAESLKAAEAEFQARSAEAARVAVASRAAVDAAAVLETLAEAEAAERESGASREQLVRTIEGLRDESRRQATEIERTRREMGTTVEAATARANEAAEAEAAVRMAAEGASQAAAAEAQAALEAHRSLEHDFDVVCGEAEEFRGELEAARRTIGQMETKLELSEARAELARMQTKEATDEGRVANQLHIDQRRVDSLRRCAEVAAGIAVTDAWHRWRLCAEGVASEEAKVAVVRRLSMTALGSPRPPRTPLLARTLTPAVRRVGLPTPHGEQASAEAELEAYELQILLATLRRAIEATDEHHATLRLTRAVHLWRHVLQLTAAVQAVEAAAPSLLPQTPMPPAAPEAAPIRAPQETPSPPAPAPPQPATTVTGYDGSSSDVGTTLTGGGSPRSSAVGVVGSAESLEKELDAMEMRVAACVISRVVRSVEVTEARLLHLAMRKWHGLLTFARAFTTAYGIASQRARDAISRQAADGTGDMLSRRAAAAHARAATCVFLRLAGGTPAVYQQLQRAIGRWQTAVSAFEARELRKEVGMASERAKNLKKGWKDEREQRTELEVRVASAEAEAAETMRALRVAEEAAAATEQRGAHSASQRPSCLPRPSAASGAGSQLAAPPVAPRIKELEARAKEAREEAVKAAEGAKADRQRLTSLQKEHGPLVTELRALRAKDLGVEKLHSKIAQLKKALAGAPLERAALRMRVLAAGAEARARRNQLHSMRGVGVASALARARLQQKATALRGALHGERWRGAGSLWRFLDRARLARGLGTWCACVRSMRVERYYERRVEKMESRGEIAKESSAQDNAAALEKLRRSADEKLKKERQLATTRMHERDTLVRQVKQLQAQLRHASSMRHPSPGQDTSVASGGGGGIDMGKSLGRSAAEMRTRAAEAAGGDGSGPEAVARPNSAQTPARPRRAAVPKRGEGATGSMAADEARELREALSNSRHEKVVLQCELDALRLEMETMRELMSS